jgi:hypothetical protein
LTQFQDRGCITHLVSMKFIPPEIAVPARQPKEPAALVSMPKAAMDEYGRSSVLDDNIGTAWQSTVVQAKPNAAREEAPAQNHFRQCVLSADSAHHRGAH